MTESSKRSLPHDVVSEILLRLPARSIARFRAVSERWRASISNPSFLRAQSRQAPPAVLFQQASDIRLVLPERISPSEWQFYLYNVDGKSHPIKRSIDYATVPHARIQTCLQLESFCDDFLCFRNCDWDSDCTIGYYVYNLITREWTPVPQLRRPSLWFLIGFYFHPPTREYRLLREVGVVIMGEGFELHGLEVSRMGSDLWRPISNASHDRLVRHLRPDFHYQITVQGCMYWVTQSDDSGAPHTDHTQLKTSSQKSIIAFDTDSEEFRTMPLPGNQPWRFNYLFDMEGRLGLCQVTFANKMVVWGWEDSRNWVKRCEISTASFNYSPQKGLRILSCNIQRLEPLAVWKQDELLLHYGSMLFIYNFKLGTLQPVETNLRKTALCFVCKESLAFYEAFRTDHSRPWHEGYYIDDETH